MAVIVDISQKALTSMESLPADVQAKLRRAIEYIKSDNERSIKPQKLEGGRNLYSGRINSKYRVIYSKKKDSITIVDIIRVDSVSRIMRSDS